MQLLVRREHSREELRNKLLSRDFDATEIDAVLHRLAEQNLQSDERFTEALVTVRIARGVGPVRIMAELRQKGVDDVLIETFVDSRDKDWLARAQTVRAKRFGQALPEDYKERAKQARFLQYRGFTSEQIRGVMKEE